jgi:hypothetical protein
MKSRLLAAGAFVLAACVASPSAVIAQSLAAIAEKAATRNSAAVKTYTNEDLDSATASRGDAPAVPQHSGLADAGIPAVEESAKPNPRPAAEKVPGNGEGNVVVALDKNSSAENEPYWRRVTKSVKDRIAKAEGELTAIAGLVESAGGSDREKLTALQSKRQRDLEFLNAEYAGHVKRAKALGVPADWLR